MRARGRAYARTPGEDRYRFLSRDASAGILPELGDMFGEQSLLRMSDWGEGVDIEAPPASLVDCVEQ